MDWHGACIVLLYKRKGDKCECSNSRGISLLSADAKSVWSRRKIIESNAEFICRY